MELTMHRDSLRGLAMKAGQGDRLTLEPNETLRLSPRPRGLRVVAGCAWISWLGSDIVLYPGDSIGFTAAGDQPVLSAAGRDRLMVELLAAADAA